MTTPPRSRDNAAQQGPSRQYVVGRSDVRRGRWRLQNQIEKLEATLKREIRNNYKYKKRDQRLAGENKSPRPTVNYLLRNQIVKDTIRKRLLLQEAIIEDIRNKYKNTRKEREKQIIAKTTKGKIIKKYRLQRDAENYWLFKKARSNTRWSAVDI
ncbi:hypothetical protein KUCAC02_005429 [Chaenocephalus aceratus]|uniref:Uncharacterized protein n=1 Tax=Chaenocephalus aceratus TaxID=36190 RepID=A0ACB9WNS9_CHAAC|nr:hypothetical protein KUCAC02_005429 [Chaenocephalus aceratus]